MMIIRLKRQWKPDAVTLFYGMLPAPAWTDRDHIFLKWTSVAISIEHFDGFDELIKWIH